MKIPSGTAAVSAEAAFADESRSLGNRKAEREPQEIISEQLHPVYQHAAWREAERIRKWPLFRLDVYAE